MASILAFSPRGQHMPTPAMHYKRSKLGDDSSSSFLNANTDTNTQSQTPLIHLTTYRLAPTRGIPNITLDLDKLGLKGRIQYDTIRYGTVRSEMFLVC